MSGAYDPTGSIIVTLKLGSTTVFTTSFAAANTSYTAQYTLPSTGTVTGTYVWSSSYSGDGNNTAANDQSSNARQTVVSPAAPTLTTTATATDVPAGTTTAVLGGQTRLLATTTINGGYDETGTITFTLVDPHNNVVDTETVQPNGNGTYSTPTGYVPTIVGVYQWNVRFAGDGNNVTATSTIATFTITAATPTIFLTDAGGVYTGSAISATATIQGAFDPASSTLEGVGVSIQYLALPSGATVAAPTNVGSYEAIATFPGSTDYTSASTSITFSITQAPSTTTVADPGGTYNASPFPETAVMANGAGGLSVTNPADFTFSYSGSNGTTYGPTSVAPTNAGTYSVTATYLGDSNHASSSSAAVPFTINKANATIVVTPYNVTYNAQPHSATDTVTGVPGDSTAAGSSITLNTTHTNVGNYTTDSWSFNGGTNYNSASGTIDDVINISGTISGTVYVDALGLGLTTANVPPTNSGDTPEAGVTIDLFGVVNGNPAVIASTTTASDGTYAFSYQPAGLYGLAEIVPTNQYQTGPNALNYVFATSAASINSAGNNFSNYLGASIKGLTVKGYVVTTPAGVSTTVSTLTGNVVQGDTVTANFSIAAGSAPLPLSLVAYEAPAPYYSSSNVSQQVITSVTTGTYGPGTYSQTVVVPDSYFQVDFVPGVALPQLEYDGSHVDYNFENRLISYANGGTQAYSTSTLSGIAYVDNLGNGVDTSGDPLLANVPITLTGTTDTGLAVSIPETTSSTGAYSFTGLVPGVYTVTETAPSGYTVEPANVGSNGGTGTVGTISSVALNSNTSAANYNFGQYQPTVISGTVYDDDDFDDMLDSGDTGISGETVYLYNSTGTVQLATTRTASDGTYSFTNLKPGNYIVTELAPSTYTGEIPNAGSAGGTPTFTSSSALEEIAAIVLGSGSSGIGYNFPQHGATISGIAYADATGNGLSSTNEPITGDTPQAGLTVNLYASGWIFVESTVTASNGSYSFKGLPYGSYAVTEGVPSGQIQTGPIMQTTTSSTEPIGDSGFEAVSVANGCYVYNPTGSAWTFTGQSGVTGNNSAFTSGDGNAPQGNDVAFLQEQGSISQVVPNWIAGSYQISLSAAQRSDYGLNNEDFEILIDGNVVATFDPKGSAYQTLVTPSFYVSSGSHIISFQGLDTAGGDNTVFLDNVSAFQNMGHALVHTSVDNGYNVNVSAVTPASTNNNFSNYTFPNLAGLTNVYYSITTPAGVTTWGSLSSAVQGDTVTAYFTINPGSSPEMLSLVAYEAPASSFSSSTAYEQVITSDTTGTYGPGTYSESVTLPNSYFQVDFVGGAPLTQLELDGSKIDYNYQNRLISAANGGTQAYALSTISGVVYNDANGNDSYGSGDNGIGGVPVYLYNGTGTVRLATTTTASNGTYSFPNLALGTYIVAEFPPSGYTGENPNVGSIGGSGNYNSSSTLEQIGSINLNSNTSANSYNFGQFKPVSISGTVYRDKNFDDVLNGPDVGIGGVTVYLKSTSGAVLATTTTASNGTYSFTGLNPGVYQIAESKPNGYILENSDIGSAGGTAGLGSLTSITLNSGTNATGYNLAQYEQVSANGYYSTSAGQSQIENNGGSLLSTSLGTWLAQNCSILCDSGYVNLSGQCNLTVVNFYLQIQIEYGVNSWQCSILTAALDEYFGKC
jgi:hypothetical protein